jgi:hypothetical protein
MRQASETDHGLQLRALIVVLWRAGLRIGEAMREVGMDDWGFDQLHPWIAAGSRCRSGHSCVGYV